MAAITMIGSGLAALAQDDIKRVLAYSTIGQLGYMAGALAVGDRGAAVFHLLSHGAFKAVLFLAAGVVIHAAGTNSLAAMSRMGGLTKRIPDAYWTMTVALLALAAIPRSPASSPRKPSSSPPSTPRSGTGTSPPPPPAGPYSSPDCSPPSSPPRTPPASGSSPSGAAVPRPPTTAGSPSR